MSGYLLSFGKVVKTSPRCFSKEFNYTRNVQHTFVQVDPSGAQQAKFTGAVTGEQISSQTV